MQQFIDLLKKERHFKEVKIYSITPMTDGYLLAVCYERGGGSYTERAVAVFEEQYGLNKGKLHIGWSNIMHEHDAPEPRMREWGPNHPEYNPKAAVGEHPTDWNGGDVVFRNAEYHDELNRAKKFVGWNWIHYNTDTDIVSYPIK